MDPLVFPVPVQFSLTLTPCELHSYFPSLNGNPPPYDMVTTRVSPPPTPILIGVPNKSQGDRTSSNILSIHWDKNPYIHCSMTN